jgi:TPR repeat protein
MASRYLPFLTTVIMLAFGGGVAAAECPELYEQARKTRETGVSTAAAERCGALANKGDATGRYLLGLLKIDGIGTPADPEGGARLVREAAEGGLPAAQARLGRMHLRGEAVANDPATAADWFERAAMGGDPLAQYELGQLRYKGLGIEADAVEAFKWFSAAAHNFSRAGNVPRQKLAERKRDTVAAGLDSGDREQAEAWLTAQPGLLK